MQAHIHIYIYIYTYKPWHSSSYAHQTRNLGSILAMFGGTTGDVCSKWRPTCQLAATSPSTSACIQKPICHPGSLGKFQECRGSVADSHGFYNIYRHSETWIVCFPGVLCQTNLLLRTPTLLRFFSCFSSLGIASIAPLQADHEEPCRDLLGGWGLGVARGWLVDKPS